MKNKKEGRLGSGPNLFTGPRKEGQRGEMLQNRKEARAGARPSGHTENLGFTTGRFRQGRGVAGLRGGHVEGSQGWKQRPVRRML